MQNEYNILLGEDDLITAKTIKVFIEKNESRVIKIVESGEDLITTALYQYPSMIITDISLKGQLDGIEAMARISELMEIPYIFITGFTDYISLIKSYGLHPFRVFKKPFDINLLVKAVKDAFRTYASIPSHYFG
jgi:DNA-binding NtrC family response regulator